MIYIGADHGGYLLKEEIPNEMTGEILIID